MDGFPIPTPLEIYSVLPYKFPLIEIYPVVRIPVAGPAPFNTLVVVRCTASSGTIHVSNGKLNRWRSVHWTPFVIAEHDPRTDPVFQHSTTAVLQMMQASDDTSFVVAVDGVDAGFDETGRWIVSVETADASERVFSTHRLYVSSWILCYEPVLEPRRDQRVRAHSSQKYLPDAIMKFLGTDAGSHTGKRPEPVNEVRHTRLRN
jgi:hypothetical protein